MLSHRSILVLAAALALSLAKGFAADAAKPGPTLPVSVSSANYGNTPWDEVRRRVAEKSSVNPAARTTDPLATPQTYVFAPGELYESDVAYAELCRQLEAALAKKGFMNAADAQGRIAQPGKIDLILRVSSGGRRWRNPTVRTENLTWRMGLQDTERSTRSIIGGQTSLDNRAGGNDDILATAIAEQGAIGSTTGGLTEASQGAIAASGYESTRDFFLLVVDAFNYKELQEKQDNTPRQWTTFIALPREEHDSFAAVLPTLLKVGTPYFGETTTGLQIFNDARATVKLGELQVLEADVKPTPEKK